MRLPWGQESVYNGRVTQIKKVLGLDPGLSTFGWALLKRKDNLSERLIKFGLFETSPDKNLPYYADFHRRIDLLEENLDWLLRKAKPDAVAVEAFSYPRQARAATFLAGAHALCRSLANAHEVPLVQLTRTFVLKSVGVKPKGRGRKQRRKSIKTGVMDYCEEHWGHHEWPNAASKREHPADAAATAQAFLESYAHQARALAEPMPDLISSL